MIDFHDKAYESEDIVNILNPIVKEWFFSKFKEFSLPQLYGVMEIHNGNNILITAPTGGTKCVTSDTSLLIEYQGNAEIMQAEDLANLAKDKGRFLTSFDKSGKLYYLPGLKSYSLSNTKIQKTNSLVYFEDADDQLIKIRTEYGREIKLSKDHPLLVENNNGYRWIRAENIEIGEKIAISRSVPLPEKDVYFYFVMAIRNARKRSRCLVDYSDFLELRTKTKTFSKFNCLNREDLDKIRTILGLTITEIEKTIKISYNTLVNKWYKDERATLFLKNKLENYKFEENRVKIMDKTGRCRSFLIPKKAGSKIVKWLSFILSEGLIGEYTKGTHLVVSQKNRIGLLNEFLNNTKELFDLEFKIRAGSDKDYSINSTTFCYFICDLFDLKMGRGRNVPIPPWVLNLKRDLKADFLNIFFSLESTIASKNRIVLYQANKNKIETINYLLLSFGILPSLNERFECATNTAERIKRIYYKLSIYGIQSIKLFLEHIDIIHPKREYLFNHIERRESGNYINKFAFDYRKIRNLSKHFNNDIEFKNKLGSVYEVVRRTGYATQSALTNLMLYIDQLDNNDVAELKYEINNLVYGEIAFVRVTKKSYFKYKGLVVDLTVPNLNNFIGGHGGIILHNTLTSTLSIINELVNLSEYNLLEDRVYCIYINPLKSLSYDLEVNLKEPLKEIKEIAKKYSKEINIRIGVRTGDTSTSERSKMLSNPPHILITTPESLAIILASTRFRELLRDVKYCIVDEIHSLAENKRGVHLSLTLENLQHLCKNEIVRIGLSATVAPLEEVAKFLVGTNRDCKIADVRFNKNYDLKVLSPVKDLIESGYFEMHNNLYDLIDKLIQEHKTTLIFTNTRSATERVIHHLKENFPRNYTENIGAHHGSLSKTLRHSIENKMRDGELKVCVSSTSLELGLDIGYIDLVICLGSPKSIARLSQRCGRSGHKLHDTVKARLIVLDRDDLVECAVMLKLAIERKIDRINIPRNCLDVLAQQIFGIVLMNRIHVNDLFNLIRKSYSYSNLNYSDFMNIIDYLRGRYASLEDRNIYAKIWYDEETGMIGKRGKLGKVIYMTNIGTIPEESMIQVKINDEIVGVIDEAFLERLKKGDVFVLGGQRYEFKYARGQTAQVNASALKPPTIPNWFSEMLPLSFDLAIEIQKFRYYMEELFKSKKSKDEILHFIDSYLHVDEYGKISIYEFFREQYFYAKEIPNYKKIVIEHYRDKDKKYVIFHTLYGRRVNDVLSRVVAYIVSRINHRDVEIGINDNGFYLSCVNDMQAVRALKMIKSNELEKIAKLSIEKAEILRRRFRHCATRALMILRQYKGKTKRVGRQQVSSMILLNAVKRLDNNFSILNEARREVLEDLMDIRNAELIISDIENDKIKIKEINNDVPSPFAFNIISQSYSDVLKIEDKIEFLRRMHQKIVDKIKDK